MNGHNGFPPGGFPPGGFPPGGFPPGYPAAGPMMQGFPPQTVAAPAAPQPPPVPVTMLRVCFSRSLTCSGCNPCDQCLMVVRERVLPPAMLAGGFAGSREQSQRFLEAYTYDGWGRFRESLQQSVALNQLPTLDGRLLEAALAMYIEQMTKAAQAEAAQGGQGPAVIEGLQEGIAPPTTSGTAHVPPSQPEPNAPPMFVTATTVGAENMHPQPDSRLGVLGSKQVVQMGATPLTVDDITALVVPVPPVIPSAASGPQVLGNVLDVSPEEVAAHVNGANGTVGSGG